jgi:hypothetical protein
MIFVQNKTDNTRARLGVLLGAATKPTKDKEKQEKHEIKKQPLKHKMFNAENTKEQQEIKVNHKKEVETETGKDKENQLNEKHDTNNNLFQIKRKVSIDKNKKKKNYFIKLKNNMIFPINIPGCTPYDPYLINVCKNAIINCKDELPNYKEIIKKINTEFGIEEGNNLVELNSDNVGYDLKTLNTISNTKTTNFTQDKKNITHTEINTLTNFKNDTEGNIDINDIMPNPRKTLRKK